jgi:serine/threonine-protein kinase
VTPHNILMGVDGISRITDFGVARAASRLSSTRGGQVKGKLSYMAPEQFQGTPVDRRVDVYAAGAVLYEMLSGRPLFTADTEAALMGAIIRGVTVPLWEIERSVSREVSDVCMRALTVRPSERYATASDLAEALEDAAQKAGIAIATPRGVAQIVKQLAAHEPPPSVTSVKRPQDIPLPSPSGSGQRQMPPAPPSQDPATSPSQSTSVGTLAAPIAPARPPRSGKLIAGLAVVVGVGLGIGVYALTKEDRDVSGDEASVATEPAASSTKPPEPTAPPVASVPESPPSAETASSAAASASAPAAAPSAAPGRPPAAGGGRAPGGSPTTFRPDGL